MVQICAIDGVRPGFVWVPAVVYWSEDEDCVHEWLVTVSLA